MNRRDFVKMASAGLLYSSLIKPTMGAYPSDSVDRDDSEFDIQRPNILWICTDQQRYDTISGMGYDYIRTPNIDKLIETGTAFKYAYCQTPICTPSRASFMTGYYPATVRGCKNGNLEWSNAAPLITKKLADHGYVCGLSGKLHLASAMGRPDPRRDDGYSVFHSSFSHPQYREGEWPSNDYYTWLRTKGHEPVELYRKNGYFPTPLHQTTWCTDRAIEFINDRKPGQPGSKQRKLRRYVPWLFSVNYYDPHPPLDPPQEYVDRFDLDKVPMPPFRPSDLEENKKLEQVYFQSECAEPQGKRAKLNLAKYWAMVELIDDNVGRLLAALEETGQRENTLVIFTSDHGHMEGHHGLRNKGCRFYDGLVRVPLIMSWPKVVQQNVKSEALVELVDIAPTLLEITGISTRVTQVPDAARKGKSLLGLLKGQADPLKHREFAYSCFLRGLYDHESYATMIRTRKFKLVNYHGAE